MKMVAGLLECALQLLKGFQIINKVFLKGHGNGNRRGGREKDLCHRHETT